MNTESRVEYMLRLIVGVREEIKKQEIILDGDTCIPAACLDASLLCDVLEEYLKDKGELTK